MGEQYGDQGYNADLSPFRPLPEQPVAEVEAAEEVAEEEVVKVAELGDDDIAFLTEEEDIVTPEKEKYFEVAKDYGIIAEED
jgi:hypothetical protein